MDSASSALHGGRREYRLHRRGVPCLERRGGAAAQGDRSGFGGDRRAAPRAGADLGIAGARRGRAVQVARTRQTQLAAAPRNLCWTRLAPLVIKRPWLSSPSLESRATRLRSRKPASRFIGFPSTAMNSSSTAKRPAGPISP